MRRERECRWCDGKTGRKAVSLKKYGEFCSEKCARRYMEGHFCDYKGCTDEPFKEVYHIGKDSGWSYLCRKHFKQEEKYIKKYGGFWCGAD